jgi:hypothetical protein
MRHAFVLCCAYPIHGFDGEAFAPGLSAVCATHERVIPAESYTALTSVDDRLRAISHLQQKAQSLEARLPSGRPSKWSSAVCKVTWKSKLPICAGCMS